MGMGKDPRQVSLSLELALLLREDTREGEQTLGTEGPDLL